MYTEDIPYPSTFNDTYDRRSDAVKHNQIKIEDLTENDMKKTPENLSPLEFKKWK